MKSITSNRKYWATLPPSDRVAHLDSQTYVNKGLYSQLYKNIQAYYSNLYDNYDTNSALQSLGSQGELVGMKVNQARNLVRQFVSIATKGRLAFQAHAKNTDADSLTQTRLFNCLIEQIIADQNVEQIRRDAAEMESVLGLAFIRVNWDRNQGEEYVDESGTLASRGELEMDLVSMFDVEWDYTYSDFRESPWCKVRTKRNRWDLMAQHPELADRIAGAPSYYQVMQMNDWVDPVMLSATDDTVCVYEFVHKATKAVPEGIYMEYLSEDCILVDDANPWRTKKHLVPVRTQPIVNSPYGYAMISDLLPLQEMLDHNFSAIATNQAAFAVQSILNPRGSDISVEDIQGRAFIEYNPQNANGGGKPEALQLTQTAPEVFKFADTIRSHLMELSNINGALRGTPPPGVTSGTAIATLSTNSVEFITLAQGSYDRAVEEALSLAVDCYRVFGGQEQIVRMVGRANQLVVKTFKGEDLSGFDRVIIRPVNALMVSSAGRQQIAETLIKNTPFIKTPQMFLEVITTGNLDVLYEDETSELNLVIKECEELLDGKMPPILSTDNHPLHMYKALALLHDPEVRRNSPVMQNILDFAMEHKRLMDTTDPVLQGIAATGTVPQMAPQPPPPQGQPSPEPMTEEMPDGDVQQPQ